MKTSNSSGTWKWSLNHLFSCDLSCGFGNVSVFGNEQKSEFWRVREQEENEGKCEIFGQFFMGKLKEKY
ncbi:unnamed protein product [Caenorhabditis angaria]|uniref:Uncharacterized protein n=1 Tax=Caenorhabditis angaria TaxID=860376 RepID=A0A9P1IRM4_9PELO|nr:unnamed protein product [Caenorhabditis angaria]